MKSHALNYQLRVALLLVSTAKYQVELRIPSSLGKTDFDGVVVVADLLFRLY